MSTTVSATMASTNTKSSARHKTVERGKRRTEEGPTSGIHEQKIQRSRQNDAPSSAYANSNAYPVPNGNSNSEPPAPASSQGGFMKRLTTRLVRSTNSLKALSQHSHAHASRTNLHLGDVTEMGEKVGEKERDVDGKRRERSGSKSEKDKERGRGLRNAQSAMALSSSAPPLPPPKPTTSTAAESTKNARKGSKESDVRVEDTASPMPVPPPALTSPPTTASVPEARKSEGSSRGKNDAHAQRQQKEHQQRKSFGDFKAPKISTPYLSSLGLARKAKGSGSGSGKTDAVVHSSPPLPASAPTPSHPLPLQARSPDPQQQQQTQSQSQPPTHRDMRRAAALAQRGLLPASKRYSLLMNPPPDVEPVQEGGRDGMSAAEVLRRAWLLSEGRDPDAKDEGEEETQKEETQTDKLNEQRELESVPKTTVDIDPAVLSAVSVPAEEAKPAPLLAQKHNPSDLSPPTGNEGSVAGSRQQPPSPSRARARSKPLPPPLDLAAALQKQGKGRSLSPASPHPAPLQGLTESQAHAETTVTSAQSMPAIPSSMSENDKIREKAKQKAQLNAWKFPASPSSAASVQSVQIDQQQQQQQQQGVEMQNSDAKISEEAPMDTTAPSSKPSGEIEVAKLFSTPSFPVIAPPRESSLQSDPAQPSASKPNAKNGNVSDVPEQKPQSSSQTQLNPTPTRTQARPKGGRSNSKGNTNLSGSSSRNSTFSALAPGGGGGGAMSSSANEAPVSPRLRPLPPSPRSPGSMDSITLPGPGPAGEGTTLTTGASASEKVAAWLDRTPLASPRTGSRSASGSGSGSGSATPVPAPTPRRVSVTEASFQAAPAPGVASTLRLEDSGERTPSPTVHSLSHPLPSSPSRHAHARPNQSSKGASLPSKGFSTAPTLSHTISTATSSTSAGGGPKTPTTHSTESTDLPSSSSDAEMNNNRASLSVESSVGESLPLATPPLSGRSYSQKDKERTSGLQTRGPDIAESPVESDFRLLVEDSGIVHNPFAEQKQLSKMPSMALDTLHEEEAACDFVIPAQLVIVADASKAEVIGAGKGERARKSKSALFGRRRNKDGDLPEIAIPDKPQKSTSLTNLRRTVTSGFSSARAKPSPKHSLPLPPKRELSPLRSDSSATSTSPSSTFLSPRSAAFNSRIALSPTMHSRASIIVQADTIEDDESRRLSELAFLD